MSKVAFCPLLLLACAPTVAQDAFYITETYNEYTFPVVVPYTDEQRALTPNWRKSEFYREITEHFKVNPSPGKTTASSSKQTDNARG